MHDAILIEEYDGLSGVFDSLESAGVETGILSNTNPVHWVELAATDGRAPRFPSIVRARYIYASHMLKLLKPDRAIFDAVAERTGFEPQQILFFDDLEPNVLGARGAGWRAEQIDPAAGPAQQVMAALRRHGVLAAE